MGAFGLALGLMNLAFYASLVRLPIGVAVTIEFLGPLDPGHRALPARSATSVAVAAAAVGVVLISQALSVPLASLDWVGLGLAAGCGRLLGGIHPAQRPHRRRSSTGSTGSRSPWPSPLVVVAPFGLATAPQWTAEVVAKGLGIALLSSVLPYSLELVALRRLSARVFGILLSLEPAAAALAGLLVLGQRLTPHTARRHGPASSLASALVMGAGQRKDPAAAARVRGLRTPGARRAGGSSAGWRRS